MNLRMMSSGSEDEGEVEGSESARKLKANIYCHPGEVASPGDEEEEKDCRFGCCSYRVHDDVRKANGS